MSFKKLRQSTILWNRAGVFSESDTTALSAPGLFENTRLDQDVQRIDVNQDGLPDLVLAGTRAEYSGWFVQVFVNKGNRQFVDETADRVPQGDAFGGTTGEPAAFPSRVQVLDFNQDGAPDFFVAFQRDLPTNTAFAHSLPFVWLNDGTGHFTTLKMGDFIAPGQESLLGVKPRLVATRNGYSFVTLQNFAASGGLRVTGLLATRPYRSTLPILPGRSIRSDNGQFRVTYQSDGNLVLNDTRDGTALWSTATGGTEPGRALMQADGNFVVYDASGVARWSSGTGGNPGAYLWVRDDGSLVIYRPDGQALWSRSQ